MKKVFTAAVILIGLTMAEKTQSQVRVNVNLGFGVPVYYPPRPVIVYDDPYQRPVVIVAPRPRPVVVVRDEDDDCDYRYRGDNYYRERELPGRRVGWYKNHGHHGGRDRD